MKVDEWLEGIQGWILPSGCLLCGRELAGAMRLCPACAADLPANRPACGHCALPLPVGRAHLALCGRCLSAPNSEPAIHAPYRYEAPADLHSRKIQVRFNRHGSDNSPVILYYKGHRIGIATPLDFTANDRHPNQ